MKELMTKENGYKVMAFIGWVLAMLMNHITHREYFIGIAHGAGFFMFFYGIFAAIYLNMKAKKKEASEA
ncbi:hypothetical protein SAMN05421493_10661 [Pseudobutyrivibrio sp. 49]|uniref:hypothetical protein n=1 Tax=unclassified Pseudobutyrivibrio TaxID=2638619 RepID=UPI0008857750|nr:MULTISPECIES: hypothetical protein [unclassified Pseudobutyrivibrio]SDH97169.1 hypothetical protein SAMN05421493_10661 [Pseudobutyrivibrio sp. 49]SFN87225.1 hypothetical protein SAMN04487831_104172 [Pseudobutyrivibrio sp. UC1225]